MLGFGYVLFVTRMFMHMENNNEPHSHGDGQNLCMMCRMHQSMNGHGACSHCHGMYHFALLRIVLALALLGFVFWAGVCVGSFVNDGEYGHHRGGMMMDGYGYPAENMGYRVYNVSSGTAVPAMPAMKATTVAPVN